MHLRISLPLQLICCFQLHHIWGSYLSLTASERVTPDGAGIHTILVRMEYSYCTILLDPQVFDHALEPRWVKKASGSSAG